MENCTTNFDNYTKFLLEGIKVEEEPNENSRSIDAYANSVYNDNTTDLQIITPIIKFQIASIQSEQRYLVSCTNFVSELLAIPQPFTGKIYGYFPNQKTVGKHTVGLLNQAASGRLFNMIKGTIADKTKTGLLFYFLEAERYERDSYLIYDKSKDKYSFYLSEKGKNQFKEFKTIQEAINYKYGSVEKLVELLTEEEEEKDCKCPISIQNLKDAEEILAVNNEIYHTYFPQDSLGNLKRFVNLLQRAGNLNENQMRIVNENIAFGNSLNFKESKTVNFLGVNHINYDYFVKKSLTKAQYKKCFCVFRQELACARAASNAHYYFFQNLSPNERENKIKQLITTRMAK
jgi:hypothetical protein